MVDAVQVSLKCETLVGEVPGTRCLARMCDATLATMCGRREIDTEFYRLGLAARRISKTSLPLYLGLLMRTHASGFSEEVCGGTPFEEIQGVPSYALDGYTRPGREALWQLFKDMPTLKRLLAGLRSPPGKQWRSVCGHRHRRS